MPDLPDPSMGLWIHPADEGEYHWSIAFDGYDHDTACGRTIQAGPDFFEDIVHDRDQVDGEICDICGRRHAGEDVDPADVGLVTMRQAPWIDPDDPPDDAVAIVEDRTLEKGRKVTALVPGMEIRIPNDEPNEVRVYAPEEAEDDDD